MIGFKSASAIEAAAVWDADVERSYFSSSSTFWLGSFLEPIGCV